MAKDTSRAGVYICKPSNRSKAQHALTSKTSQIETSILSHKVDLNAGACSCYTFISTSTVCVHILACALKAEMKWKDLPPALSRNPKYTIDFARLNHSDFSMQANVIVFQTAADKKLEEDFTQEFFSKPFTAPLSLSTLQLANKATKAKPSSSAVQGRLEQLRAELAETSRLTLSLNARNVTPEKVDAMLESVCDIKSSIELMSVTAQYSTSSSVVSNIAKRRRKHSTASTVDTVAFDKAFRFAPFTSSCTLQVKEGDVTEDIQPPEDLCARDLMSQIQNYENGVSIESQPTKTKLTDFPHSGKGGQRKKTSVEKRLKSLNPTRMAVNISELITKLNDIDSLEEQQQVISDFMNREETATNEAIDDESDPENVVAGVKRKCHDHNLHDSSQVLSPSASGLVLNFLQRLNDGHVLKSGRRTLLNSKYQS